MARIRTIKPEFWTSEQIVELSPVARLLFIGMWNFADDGGNLPASVKTLKMQVFPGDDFTAANVAEWVAEMLHHGLVVEYRGPDGDGSYWHITGWHHQKVDRPNYKYPKFVDCSSNDRRTLDEPSPPEGNGREGKGEIKETDAQTNFSTAETGAATAASAPVQRESPPPVAPAPSRPQETPSAAAYAWASRSLEELRAMQRQAGFTAGKVHNEILKFCDHYSERPEFQDDPVGFFQRKFTGWLTKAQELAQQRKQGGERRTRQMRSAADEVTREKVTDFLKTAHHSLIGIWQERHISTLLQCPDMTSMRERANDLAKGLISGPAQRTGEIAIGSLIQHQA